MSTRNVVSRLFVAIWSGVDGVRKILHLLLLLVLFIGFAGLMSGTPGLLPSQAALLVQPVGALVEQLDGDPYDRALAELLGEAPPQTLVQDVVDALRFAKDDDRIAVVHLELSALGGAGLSNLQRIANAMDEFKSSGKSIVASADVYTQSAYYLGAHADTVYLHPEGMVLLQGFGSYRTYYKDALDTLRIDWNVFRVGTHKSFVEPYTRMDMSPEDRESRSRLINQFWSTFTADIDAARQFDDGTVNGFAQNITQVVEDANGDLAIASLNSGLVDALLDRVDIRDVFVEMVGESDWDDGSYAAIHMNDYLAHERSLLGGSGEAENVAVIIAAGTMVDGSQPPGTIGGDSTAALLRRALNDASVKAVVLRVDSGGGSIFASEVIADEIAALQSAGKPVVASMGSIAASAGYWISAVSDHVMASPNTITGSIGVFGMFPTYQRSLAALGLNTDGLGSTPLSGQLRPDREMSAEMKRLFQAIINDSYDDFIGGVAELRGMDKAAVDRVAQGQVWSGSDALQHGLIDALGSLEDAIDAAAELAGLEEGSYGQIEIAPQMSPTEQMILDFLAVAGGLGIDPAAFARKVSPLEQVVGRLDRALQTIAQFNDPKGAYSHCFCALE